MNVAIIGGIGSGKSEVLKVAREMGLVCLSADEINAELLRSPEYVEKIAARFPECVVCGVVDKPRLAALVFSDKESRLALNAIAHPEIAKKIAECDADPLVVELPLVLESGMKDMFDEIILVAAPRRERLKRLQGRGLALPRAKAIMRSQLPTFVLRRIATRTVENTGTVEELREAARNLLRILCE